MPQGQGCHPPVSEWVPLRLPALAQGHRPVMQGSPYHPSSGPQTTSCQRTLGYPLAEPGNLGCRPGLPDDPAPMVPQRVHPLQGPGPGKPLGSPGFLQVPLFHSRAAGVLGLSPSSCSEVPCALSVHSSHSRGWPCPCPRHPTVRSHEGSDVCGASERERAFPQLGPSPEVFRSSPGPAPCRSPMCPEEGELPVRA